MNAYSSNFHKPGEGSPTPAPTVRSHVSAMSIRWAAVQDAAAAVAAMAGLAPEAPSRRIRNFPALIKDVGGWKLELASRGVADLAAIMQPGVTALLAVRARGQDASIPALALWQEFEHARDALLALVPDRGSHGPQRRA